MSTKYFKKQLHKQKLSKIKVRTKVSELLGHLVYIYTAEFKAQENVIILVNFFFFFFFFF